MVGGGVQERSRPPVPRVVEAVVPTRGPGVDALAAQDDDATYEAEGGADPAGVQREAE